MVIALEKKTYQPFYTKSIPILKYMVDKLNLKNNDYVLEPCAGDGVFVDYMINKYNNLRIDCYELNENEIFILNEKFSEYPKIKIIHSDTLLDTALLFSSNLGTKYDKIIANPPYGAWQDYSKRKILKKYYPNLYVKESYSLFLYRCIKLLKNKGLLCFIIPDTYLNLHMHKQLRNVILTKTKIKELALFPSSFFPNVNFGYANLSIITLEKCDNLHECENNEFPIYSNFNKVSDLNCIEDSDIPKKIYFQKDILNNPDCAFLINNNDAIINLINSSQFTINDVAACVTGFYSGNDKLFLKVLSKDIKNSKNYDLVNIDRINNQAYILNNILDGIEDIQHFAPIVKGGNIRYLKNEQWFMDWSKKAVLHYKSDKKSRFQNPKYYFKYGIGIPMISSSSITASLIENKLFDQSIVGVFPYDSILINYLLAFFNSITCNKLIRTINPSANNPANYIKKIPFIHPNPDNLISINEIVNSILDSIRNHGQYDIKYNQIINDIFQNIYGI